MTHPQTWLRNTPWYLMLWTADISSPICTERPELKILIAASLRKQEPPRRYFPPHLPASVSASCFLLVVNELAVPSQTFSRSSLVLRSAIPLLSSTTHFLLSHTILHCKPETSSLFNLQENILPPSPLTTPLLLCSSWQRNSPVGMHAFICLTILVLSLPASRPGSPSLPLHWTCSRTLLRSLSLLSWGTSPFAFLHTLFASYLFPMSCLAFQFTASNPPPHTPSMSTVFTSPSICYGLNVWVLIPSVYVETLMSKVLVLDGKTFGEVTRSTLQNENSPLKKDAPESSLVFLPHKYMPFANQKTCLHQTLNLMVSWPWNSQPLKLKDSFKLLRYFIWIIDIWTF